MENIHVDLGMDSYDISIEKGILNHVGQQVAALTGAEKVAIISDDIVDAIYGDPLESSLHEAGIKTGRIVFKNGEKSKNIAVLSDVYNELAELDITRSDAIITLGGGVPGDLGGFAAATFLRGIPYIQIPTTVLAQVDSSVGGKVAIDLPSGKNLAGSFYQPRAVFIDPNLLHSLAPRTIHDGLAEVIKYGCIRDEKLFTLFETIHGDANLDTYWEPIIRACCSIKARIVEQDEHDTGERMVLNFGHTIGHAAEKYYGFGTMTHGEAVAAGMSMLTEKTETLGLTKAGTTQRLRRVLEKFNLPIGVDAPAEKLLEYIGHDKKKRGSDVTLIILNEIGSSRLLPVAGKDIPLYIQKGA